MLTDTAIRKAKPAGKTYKLIDGHGLHLRVQPTGSKLWQARYRVHGAERTASLGRYPEIGLAEARERHLQLRRELAKGIDPVTARRASRAAAQVAAERSFEAIARLWWASWSPGRSQRHADYVERRLTADVFPEIGSRPITEINAPDLVRMAKKIQARGAIDIAKRSLQTCSQVYRYAIAHGWATRNPAVDIRPADVLPTRRKRNYARVDRRELPVLMRKIEGYQGTPVTRLAMKLIALTFVRTTELIGARWSEFDLVARRWDVPAERMKMKAPHIVPLSTQAVEVLRVLAEITGGRELLFPGERDHTKPMSNNTILGALDRMGYKGRMTGHGFRGLASTILHEQGFDHAHIELQLAHVQRDEVSAAYNHALYLEPRARMMQWWGDFLDGSARPIEFVGAEEATTP